MLAVCIYLLLIYFSTETSDFRAACKMLESRLTMNDDDSLIHYGKHFIFLTEHTFLQLESARKQLHVECVEKIESFWIKYSKYLFTQFRLCTGINFRAERNPRKLLKQYESAVCNRNRKNANIV